MNNFKIKNWALLLILMVGFFNSIMVSAKTPIKKHRAAETVTALGEAYEFQMNGMELDILSNDQVNGNTIALGNNATVEKIGNWPTGIYINSAGKAIVVAGTVMPRVPLEYKITSVIDPSVSATAKLILYDVTNKFSGYDFYIWNEVDTNCFKTNVNEITGTLHMVYIGSTSKTLVSSTSNGDKFRINVTGYNIVDANNWDSRLHYSYYKNQITLQPFQEITFPFKKDSGTALEDYEIKLSAIRFGDMNGRDISGAPGKVLDIYNAIKVYKILNTKGNKSKNASLGHNVTALNVSTLTTAEAESYVFYDSNNIEIPASTTFPNTTVGTYVYYYAKKNSAGCIGPKASLTLTVSSSDINPGVINIGGNPDVEDIEICSGGTVEVNNQTHASTTFGTTYSWEVSEDDGNTWNSLVHLPNSDDNYSYSSSNTILYSNIIVKDITKKLWLKRKTYDTAHPNEFNYSNIVKITIVNNNIIFPGETKSYSASLNGILPMPAITSSNSNSVIKVYDGNNNEITGNIPTNTEGHFTYTVVSTTPLNCITTDQFEVIVYDITDCNYKTKKIYANVAKSWPLNDSTVQADEALMNTVTNGNESYLYNAAGFARITTPVVIAGLGTVGVDLFFTKSDGTVYSTAELKGKKITLKLGQDYSLLQVAGGISVIGRKTTASTANAIAIGLSGNTSSVGMTVGVKGGLVDLLKGDNVFTFSFTPKDIQGRDVEFNGVRIQLGSLVSAGDLAKVFYAYIEEDISSQTTLCNAETIKVTPLRYTSLTESEPLYPSTQSDIDGNTFNVVNKNIELNKFVHDITWGNRSEVVNLASSLSSIVHPYFAVDNDYNTYALFNSTVGVLNQQFLQIQMRQRAEPGDQVRVVLSYPNINLINLSLLQLGNFKIVYYLGDAIVGEDPLEQFRVLDIGLFNLGNHKKAVLTKPVKVPFDRVEIRQFQTINVNIGDGLHIYDVRIQPQMLFEGQTDPKQITKICAAEPLAIQKPSVCTSFEVSFAQIKQWGAQLSDEDGNPLYETGTTNPIKSILEIQDIPNSSLQFTNQTTNISGTFTDNFNIAQLYKQYENDGMILLKVQSMRQGCPYGEPEYLKIRLQNCRDAVSNPSLRILSK